MTLKNILGEGKISEEEIDRIAYSSDASQIRGRARSIIWPETTEDAMNAVKYCLENNIIIVARGGGTGLVGGVMPEDSVVMDLSRMNKIEIYEDYIVAEPGVILENLNAKTEKFFPVTPGSKKACTIGGMIATNAAGMRSIKYGKMESWVEELEIVDGNGDYMKIGEEKIKDFCGKEGTTGIILKAKLRIIDKPKEVSLSILKFDEISKLIEKVKELKNNKVVSAIEYIDRTTSESAGLGNRYNLIVEYESKEGEIQGEDMESIWNMRDGLYPLVAGKGYTVIEDPEISIEEMDKFLTWLENNEIPTFGHISIGVVHPHFKKGSTKIGEMFGLVKSLNGGITGEHGIGILKKQFLEEEKKEEINKLKQIYDKSNILNRGKVI